MTIFSVIGFGLTTTALLITFAKYFTKDWFGYFMFGLVLFEVCMFTLTKGKTVEPERPPTRTEKSTANRPAVPPDSPKAASAKASNQSPKSQASNKQEKAAEKTAKKAEKAQAKEAKAEAKAAAAK